MTLRPILRKMARLASGTTAMALLFAAFGLGYQSVGSVAPQPEIAQISAIATNGASASSGGSPDGSGAQAFTPMPEEDETGGEPHLPSFMPDPVSPVAVPPPASGFPLAGHTGSPHRPPWA